MARQPLFTFSQVEAAINTVVTGHKADNAMTGLYHAYGSHIHAWTAAQIRVALELIYWPTERIEDTLAALQSI